MRSQPGQTIATALTRAQSEDVLRYWLAALRLEEALQTRPQARRAPAQYEPPHLELPTPGQEYFKVALNSELGALLADDTPLVQPMDGELSRFFESWLYTQYRRSSDDSELSHLLCFPVVHLPRGELAGLLRSGVRLRFGKHDGLPFRTPSWSERQRGHYPDPPDEARVLGAPRAEGAWPFFVDTRLLRHPLGVSSESIDALFDALRARDTVSPQEMLALVITMLEGAASSQPHEDAHALESNVGDGARAQPEALLVRLTAALRTLLQQAGSRAQVYPVAIVVDGSQAKTTWHLQRELTHLLEAGADDAWSIKSPLGIYLTGQPQALVSGLQRALFEGPALTKQQRVVAQEFWSSPLSAVQGPPGTGKTTLILHLCAEALLRQMESFADAGRMTVAPFVVTSSNNRAVDNVLDPLTQREGLPLALRVGNRQVCEHTLSAQLNRALTFLQQAEREPASLHKDALAQSCAELQRLRAEIDRLLAPRLQAQRLITEHARLTSALTESTKSLATALERSAHDDASAVSAAHAKPLLDAMIRLEKRFAALSKLCEAKPGLLQVNAVARHYGRTAARDLPAFEAALLSANLTLDLPLPPLVASMDVSEMMAAWEEGTEQCLARLAELREKLERARDAHDMRSEVARLRRELDGLAAVPSELPEPEDHDALSYALFQAAVAVREAWAKVNAATLRLAIEAALRVVKEERSLRPLFRHDEQSAKLLQQLFGIWGSTLLSLGNCLPMEADCISRVVIDEAGQCHPAHAISALLRARSALVLGDVHQLAPVIELGADDELRLLRSCRLSTPAGLLDPYRVHNEAWSSAQTLADRAVRAKRGLTDHFRCQPEIIAISDELCDYKLTVHTPRAQRSQELPFLRHPVMLADLRGEQERLAGSLFNELELREILRLVSAILAAGIAPTDLAVITPYRGQLERLRRSFVEQRIPTEHSHELTEDSEARSRVPHGVALGTVHRFQGGERSIVLFSSVISRSNNLTFLNARPNLLNVAISRARHHFVCVGHREVLAQGARTRLLVRASQPLETRQDR
jgi:hypothetical protein